MTDAKENPAGGPGLEMQANNDGLLSEYIAAGLALVALKPGTKVPAHPNWQKAGHGITSAALAATLTGVGIHHLDSHTCCIDIDDMELCTAWFAERHIDLVALLADDDAVQITSGKPGRAKLLYRLPDGVAWLKYVKTANGKLELRCANSDDQSQQDVLPPSIHPDTGKPYQWRGMGNWRAIPTLPDAVLAAWQEAAATVQRVTPTAATHPATVGVVEGGSRNTTMTSMAGAMRRKGFDEAAIGSALLKHNATHCDPPLSSAEVARIAHSVARYEPAASADLIAENDAGNIDLSHDTLALRLGDVGGWNDDARYVAAWGKWLFFDGALWVRDEKLRHMTDSRAYLRRVAVALFAWAETKAAKLKPEDGEKVIAFAKREGRVLRSAQTRVNVEVTARSNPASVVTADQFDADMDVIGTPGGVVDLRTGHIRPAQRDDYLTRSVAVTPCSTAPTRWLTFLRESMDGDEGMVVFLQRLAGYALTGHTSEHKLPFVFGPGGNGKSVFANTLHGIFAAYGAKAPAEAFLQSRGERHPTDLAGLAGARLVIGSELPAGRAWNESVVKDLTGGDEIAARFMRQDFFTFKPQFTLMMVGNHMPAIGSVDDAMRRRVLLIPFTHTVPAERRDRDLPERLKAEWPGILQWAVEGAVAWYQHGLAVPDKVQAASAEYLEAEDVLGQFMEECLVRDTAFIGALSSDAHATYCTWMDKQGGHAMTQRAFSQSLRERGVTIKKDRDGAHLTGWRLAETTTTAVAYLARRG